MAVRTVCMLYPAMLEVVSIVLTCPNLEPDNVVLRFDVGVALYDVKLLYF